MNFNTLKILDGFSNNIGDGAIVAVVSIALVFLILGIIIFITYVVGSAIQKAMKSKPQADETPVTQETEWEGLDPNDEDAVAAVIAASIDYREETKKNVRVVKVKEIK